MHDDLVGFLTGALDASEHNEIQKRLDESADLREQLAKIERCLSPLSWDKEDRVPPVGLAAKTCKFVENHIEENKVELASARKERIEALAAESSGWTFSDFVVAAGICLAAACLFFPAVLNSRYNARLAHCQNNMRQLGRAFQEYSESNNGYFPAVPAKGKLAFAGSYAAMLRDKNLIDASMSSERAAEELIFGVWSPTSQIVLSFLLQLSQSIMCLERRISSLMLPVLILVKLQMK